MNAGMNDELMVCRLVYMEELNFRQQLEAYAHAQVLVMGHGAAFTNILFMAPVRPSWKEFQLRLHELSRDQTVTVMDNSHNMMLSNHCTSCFMFHQNAIVMRFCQGV